MKKVLFSIMSLVSALCLGQEGRVGVNTTDPKTTMDVRGKTNALGVSLATDITGLQAPRLTREDLTNKNAGIYGADQIGALVYITDATQGDNTGQRVNVTTPGYYYFDGLVWQKMASGLALSNISADNGLSTSSSNNVQLGGTLLKNTEIVTAGFNTSFTGTGRLGIGILNPSQALDVRGNINVENANAGVVVNSTDSTPSRLVLTRSNGGVNLAANDEIGRINFNGRRNGAVATLSTILSTYEGNGTTNLTGYEFYNNGILTTPSLVLRSTGNLGVGVVSPSEKLDVNGNIKFSGALMPNNDPGTNFQILKSTGSDSPPVWSPDVNTLGNGAGRVSSANGVSTTITPCNTSAANKNVTLIRVFSNLDGLNNGLYLELLVTTGANTGVQELHNLRFNGGTTTADTSTAGTWTYNLGNGIFRVILSGTNRPFTVRFEGASFAGNIVYECLR
ncbi:hypothetical protein [Chryseobacterium binzhouense]|uniref:hypothetical protein n=1 Tax=Chryseobacterium binzhouense TaxID=2593646 RepID=UPI00289CBB3B|nr:hypothetical protein [Chryseobacterium binzhouense]